MFTDEELEAAILKFLQSDVTVARSEAGARDVLKTKEQVYELIGGVFLLRPHALFAICWLASNRLRALVAEQLRDMQTIVDSAPRASEVSKPVTNATDLYNAEAALLSLTAAFSAREGGVRGSIGPSVQRFSASVERFVREQLLANTVVKGEVVDTGEALRGNIAQTWATMRLRHETIAAGVTQLKNALQEFAQVKLPDTVVGGIMTRVQARLAELTTVMESAGAAAQSREAMLDLCAMRVLLRRAGTFELPVLQKAPLTSDAVEGALTTGAGIPASIMGTVSGPFYYGPGTVLSYSVGGVSEQVTLPRHSAAVLQSKRMSPWVAPAANLACVVRVNGGSPITVTTGAWSSGSEAAKALEKGLSGVLVTWQGEKLEMRTGAVAGASLELKFETDAARGFGTWFGSVAKTIGEPVRAQEVAGTIDKSTAVSARVVRVDQAERLELYARESGPSLHISSGPAAAALGLSTEPVEGSVGVLTASVPFTERGVAPGDVLVLAQDQVTYTVTEVNDRSLTFSPPRAPASVGYAVRDGAYASYLLLQGQLVALEVQAGWDLVRVDQAVGRLGRGARYTGELVSAVTDYQAALFELLALCDDYRVTREPAVEEIVRTLSEHGFDRALDFLLSLQLKTFFALSADGVSYRTWVVRTAAEAARIAAPVSKGTPDPTSRWRTVAVVPSQYDPSRQ